MILNATLPPEEADILKDLRASDNIPELRARVLALRSRDWSLRSIGDPLNVSRQAVANWEEAALLDENIIHRADELLDVIPRPPLPPLKPRRIYPKVPSRDAERMRELVPVVARLRASTPAHSPVRKATEEFQDLIWTYVQLRGVTEVEVSRAAGVTHKTISTHLQKRM